MDTEQEPPGSLIRNYWIKVFKRAWEAASRGTKLRYLLFAAIGAALVLGVQVFLDDAWYSIVTGLFWFIMLLVAAIYQIPAKMYEELGGFIDYPFKITCLPPKPRDAGEHRAASLEIQNVTAIPVDACFLMLDGVASNDGGAVNFEGPRRLEWSAREGIGGERPKRELPLTRGAPRIANIAEQVPNHDKIRFTLWNGMLTLGKGRFELAVTPHGQWKDKTVQGRQILIVMEYQGGNQLAIWPKGENAPSFPLSVRKPSLGEAGTT